MDPEQYVIMPEDSGSAQSPLLGTAQSPLLGTVQNLQIPYIPSSFQNPMMNTPALTSGGPLPTPAFQAHLAQQQLSYQQVQQQHFNQLERQIRMFWASQSLEIQNNSDFKNHSLPLARIKKIMKADEDVRMIAAEAPVLFARACEMFILELTYRSWAHTEENKRRTLQKNDIAGAIMRTGAFDFLVDIVPREDIKDEVMSSMPSSGGPSVPLPYYYDHLGMLMNKPDVDPAVLYAQQQQGYMPQPYWGEQQQQSEFEQQQQSQEQSREDP